MTRISRRARLGVEFYAILSMIGLAGIPAPAAAQTRPAAARPAADAAIEAARTAFESLPEQDRKAVQEALIWLGLYSGMADGSFGRQTFEAITAYQRQSGQDPNGVPSPAMRSALTASGLSARNAAGFTLIDDPRSGVRIGVPAKVLPKQDINPNGGSRWQSPDGKITLDTRTAPPDATLQSLYDRNLAIQAAGRVVTYKVIRPDFFVIAGETATGKFYTRYAGGPDGIRAFSIGYDKALAPNMDRLVVAIANSFVPFPTAPAAATQTASPPQVPPPASANGSHLIGTGLVVAPRQVLTAAPVGTCPNLQVANLKPRQITGKAAFLLEFSTDLKAKPFAPVYGSLQEDLSLLIAAFADETGTSRLTAAPGTASGETAVTAPLQPGASGAPVLDASGALIGLVDPISSDQRRIAGIVPAMRHTIVPISRVTDILPAAAGSGQESSDRIRSTADIVSLVGPALVPIVCDR